MDLPEPEPEVDEPGDEGWLFDSQRDYWTQLGYYKRHQGKPMPTEKKKQCEFCGEEFYYTRKTARYCKKACSLSAHRSRKNQA